MDCPLHRSLPSATSFFHVLRIPADPTCPTQVDPRDIVEIVVEFDEGEEVLTPKTNERFDSYDLNEAARYIFFLSNYIVKGGY